jgi:hypothetical protein
MSSQRKPRTTHVAAIHFMHYGFVRIHQTLKVAPAMAAGVSDNLWEMSDMAKVLEDWEALSLDATRTAKAKYKS